MDESVAREAFRRYFAREPDLSCSCGGSIRTSDVSRKGFPPTGMVECDRCGDREYPSAPVDRQGETLPLPASSRDPRCQHDGAEVVTTPATYTCPWCGASRSRP